MSTQTVVGIAATLLTEFSLLPQVVKAFRTKHTNDISLSTLLMILVGAGTWFAYGLMWHDNAIVVANAIMVVNATLIFVLKMRYDKK